MKISAKQYAQALYEGLKGKTEHEQKGVIADFVRFLAGRDLVRKGDKIANELKRIQDREAGRLPAAVESALPLSADEEKLVAGFLKKETAAAHIELEKAVRPELLGGVVIKYGDRIFDGSLKARLGQLKKVFK